MVEFSQDEYMKNWEKIDAENTFIKKITKTIKFGIPASIQDFRPTKLYPDLSPVELNSDSIKSEINKVYNQYFETVHVVKDLKYGAVDSLPEAEYDPEYYPDSVYAYLGKASRQIQPTSGMEVNFTNYLFSLEKCLIITSYQLGEYVEKTKGKKEWEFINEDKWHSIVPLINEAKAAQIPVYIISNAPKEKTDEFSAKLGFTADFLVMDPIEIKIIIRSNPGIVYIEKAVVKGNWDYNRVPKVSDLK
jgi:hypothetical protein